MLGLLCLNACSQPKCCYDAYGADEFIIDSYRIREGKLAILDLIGVDSDPLTPDMLEEHEDLLHEGDVLSIALYHPTRTDLVNTFREISSSIGFTVTDGMLWIPDIADVEVAGLSLRQARSKIQAAFAAEIEGIELFLAYKDRLTRRVDFTGLTGTPYLPVDGKMRLHEALSKARVSHGANFFMSYILRDGRPLSVDFYRLMVEGDMSQNIVLHGGDQIYIAHAAESQAFVMGEVMAPKSIPLTRGYLPLAEALVYVGGIPFTGDLQNIQVIRGSLRQPKVYFLAWEHIVHLPNESLLLMPGDIVYVTEHPMTRWNRFISQIVPSFNNLKVGQSAYQSLAL
jgi:polysaccharide export outer membrane protein